MALSSPATRLLGAVLALALLAGCTPAPTPLKSSSLKLVSLENGLSPQERALLYHEPEGSEFLPLTVLKALHNSKGQPFLASPQLYGLLEDPENPDQLPVGISKYRFSGVPFDVVGFNCAACHVNELTYKNAAVRVDGAPGFFNLTAFYVELFGSIEKTLKDPVELAAFFVRFAEQRSAGKQNVSTVSLLRQVYDDERLPKNDPDVQAYVQSQAEDYARQEQQGGPQAPVPHNLLLTSEDAIDTFKETVAFLKAHYQYLKRLKELNSPTVAGPGRLDAFGGARGLLFGPSPTLELSAPVSYPFLWGFPEQAWIHYDGNTNSIMQRNMGQALGVGATFDPKTYASTLLPRQIDRLNKLTARLKAPRWPEDVFGKIDPVRSEAGRAVFAENCVRCHGPSADQGALYSLQEIGTDPYRVQNFDIPLDGTPYSTVLGDILTKIENQAFEDAKLTPEERKSIEPTQPVWRTTGKYAVRPLAGIWATAPYLHNGSVPTLRALLQPAAQRPTCFHVGQREYDPESLGYVDVPDTAGQCAAAKDSCSTAQSDGTGEWLHTRCAGNLNSGHEYGTNLPDEQKRHLLEYLKTL